MKRQKSSNLPTSRRLYKELALLLLIVLAGVVFLPQLHFFGDSLGTIRHADTALIMLALVFVLTSYISAAATYVLLAVSKIRFWPTVLIQVADGFTNRLLPASIGGLATNTLYLISQRHTKAKAGFVVTLDNILGFVGHLTLLLILLAFSTTPFDRLFVWRFPSTTMKIIWGSGLIIVLSLMLARPVRRRIYGLLSAVSGLVKHAFVRPMRLLLALVYSMLTTVSYAGVLYATTLAVNVHLSLLQAFVAMTVGVAAIVITPTPGGIGGVELGLTTTLTGMGVPAQQALSVALVYRLLTYWLPLLPGFVAFRLALKRNYLKSAWPA